MKKTGITVLGSGSSGNSLLIHNKDSAILIDAGFSRKEMLARLATADINPAIIKGLLISHEHGDHVKGARLIADYLDIPTFLSHQTYKHMKSRNLTGRKVNIFNPGSDFQVDIFNIHSFSVPHDAMEPVGFTLSVNNTKIGVATDIGHINNLVKARLNECNALILECNHDIKMLKKSDRSLNLKRRIMGRFGHLNNDDAMKALDELLHKKTEALILYHLSGECNTHELVKETVTAKLTEMKREDIICRIAMQDTPLDTVWIFTDNS